MQYVIIGGGIAGVTAAEELRKRDSEASITIVEAEAHRLYSRVLLPHYAEGRVPREKVFLKKPEWYAAQNIEYLPEMRVVKIDVSNAFVELFDGRELPYDKLLIASGGDVRLLESDVRGVSYLRTLDDVDQLLQMIGEAKTEFGAERSAFVYGGGFIALEYLNIFHAHGFATSLAMRAGGFWSRILSQHSQQVMKTHVEAQGVRVFLNEPQPELIGEKQLQGVRLKDGTEVKVQLLGVGLGIESSFELFTDAGFEVGGGVVANEFLETSQKNVYTAGDVAEFFDIVSERRLLLGNWMNALMQGRHVARVMTGERTPFELVSSYATDFLGKDAVFIGDVDREQATVRQLVATDGESLELFDRDGRTVGAVMIGDVSRRQAITNAIKNKELFQLV